MLQFNSFDSKKFLNICFIAQFVFRYNIGNIEKIEWSNSLTTLEALYNFQRKYKFFSSS